MATQTFIPPPTQTLPWSSRTWGRNRAGSLLKSAVTV